MKNALQKLFCFLVLLAVPAFSATLASVGVSSSPSEVSAQGKLSIFAPLVSSIPTGGRLQIILPPTVSIESGTLSCTMIEPSSVGVTCTGVVGTS